MLIILFYYSCLCKSLLSIEKFEHMVDWANGSRKWQETILSFLINRMLEQKHNQKPRHEN